MALGRWKLWLLPSGGLRPAAGMALVAALGIVGPEVCRAQQTWAAGNGSWMTDANWSPYSAGNYPNAIGAGAIFLTGNTSRTISLGGNVTLGTLGFNSTSAYTVSGGRIVFDNGASSSSLTSAGSGAKTISSNITVDSQGIVVNVSGGSLSLSGTRSGAGSLTKEGVGNLTLSGTSTLSGPTFINAGNVTYSTSGAIAGGTAVTVGDGAGAAGSARLLINTSMSANSTAFALSVGSDGQFIQGSNRLARLLSVSGTGSFTLNSTTGNAVMFVGDGGANDSTYSGTIAGGVAGSGALNPDSGSRLSKMGTSTLTLSGNNTYVSRTYISGGAIRAASNNALGSSADTNGTYISGGGSLELSGGVTLAEVIAINGAAAGGAGALRSVSGNNTVTKAVSIGWAGGTVTSQNATVSADAGSTLNLAGGISGNRSLTKSGEGTVRLGGPDARTGTFATTVEAGTLALAASGGNALAGTALTINSGGTLLLEAPEQIGAATGLVLSGGTFSTGAGFSETLGALTLAASSEITLGGAAHLLSFANSSGVLWNPLATLTITGWSGTLAGGGEFGRIFFGSGGLGEAQLANINFAGFDPGARLLASGELVPISIPEPGAIAAGVFLVLVACWREKGRAARLTGNWAGIAARPGKRDFFEIGI